MPGRSWAALLVGMALVAACQAAPASTGFTVEYGTGSIPPPFNHEYTLDGAFEAETVMVRYDLTYRFREGMTEQELAEQGYSPEDDLHWEGTLTGQAAADWRELVASTRIGPAPEPLPGGDSFMVTVRFGDGSAASGMPDRRDRWEALVDAVDQQARAETGHPRPHR